MTQADLGHVLVVDDDPEIRAFLEVGLGAFGFRAESRASAEEALTSLTPPHRTDVVLSDLKLPGSSGLDLCRALRTKSAVPIIMATVAALDGCRTMLGLATSTVTAGDEVTVAAALVTWTS